MATTNEHFCKLILMLQLQGLMALGQYENPITKTQKIDFSVAESTLNALSALEKKSEGNCSNEEMQLLTEAITTVKRAHKNASAEAEIDHTEENLS